MIYFFILRKYHTGLLPFTKPTYAEVHDKACVNVSNCLNKPTLLYHLLVKPDPVQFTSATCLPVVWDGRLKELRNLPCPVSSLFVSSPLPLLSIFPPMDRDNVRKLPFSFPFLSTSSWMFSVSLGMYSLSACAINCAVFSVNCSLLMFSPQ